MVNSGAGMLGPEFRQKMDQLEAFWEEVLHGPVLEPRILLLAFAIYTGRKAKEEFLSLPQFFHTFAHAADTYAPG